ncbi:Karyogamy protein KAR4 [Operophtera brumata]|uniref:Karyogamy protein KAR4 n=1 Tax=Operophtera brumata TaxID=104452 RepID=A0A0L7LJP4_OPEBR|nr:Karyogamy protein KAR4 [Operophtera brumata]
MSDKLKELRERSQKRKKLLAQTLGVSSVSELRHALGSNLDVPSKKQAKAGKHREPADKTPTKEQADELVYTDSSTFLKTFDLKQMNNKFDVVLVEPPLGAGWRWRDVQALELQHVAQPRSFIFLCCL